MIAPLINPRVGNQAGRSLSSSSGVINYSERLALTLNLLFHKEEKKKRALSEKNWSLPLPIEKPWSRATNITLRKLLSQQFPLRKKKKEGGRGVEAFNFGHTGKSIACPSDLETDGGRKEKKRKKKPSRSD